MAGRTQNSSRKAKIRGLWKHSNGFWYFSRMRNGVRKTVALETTDETEAARRALDAVDSPELALTGTFESEINAFIAYKERNNEYSRFTSNQRKIVLKKFMRWFGEDNVPSKVRPDDIQRFYAEQTARLKESTVQSYITSALGPFFVWLKEERRAISVNPTDGVKMSRIDLQSAIRDRFCSPALRDALLAGWKDIPNETLERDRALWVGFILHSGFEAGMRKNEIIEARPGWFDIEARVVRIAETSTFRPKDREKRAVPLSDRFLTFLKDCPLDQGTWCIAPTTVRGRSEYRYDFSKPFETYLAWIQQRLNQDISWVTPHVMRHTVASLLASSGVSLLKLGDIHKTAERHYAHLQARDYDINKLRFSASPRRASNPSRRKHSQHATHSS